MPTPAYLYVKGIKQGDITNGAMSPQSVGSLAQDGHDKEALVLALRHEVNIPQDTRSGAATGQRVHNPVVITKVFDKSSPLLYKALVTNETLPEVTIKWYRPSTSADMEHYFTHKLENALVVDIKAVMPNCQDPSQAHFTHLEEISFAYQKITWTHVIGKTEHTDDWKTAVK